MEKPTSGDIVQAVHREIDSAVKAAAAAKTTGSITAELYTLNGAVTGPPKIVTSRTVKS